MRRMLNPDKVIKSIKIADDTAIALIGKENFRFAYGSYFVNIQTINQTGYDGTSTLSINVDGASSNGHLFRNNSYSIGLYQDDVNVILSIVGIVYDNVNDLISPEVVTTIANVTLDDVLSTIAIGSNEDFDLYVLKD